MTRAYEPNNIRGTWVRFETLDLCFVVFKTDGHKYDLKHLESVSFPQVSMDIFEVNLDQNLRFLIVTERSLVRRRNFSITQR